MTVAELIEMLCEANPEEPVTMDYCGVIFNADSVQPQNGVVTIQGS